MGKLWPEVKYRTSDLGSQVQAGYDPLDSATLCGV